MIYLGADHGGYKLKESMKSWLTEWGYEWKDLGNTILDSSDDFPKFAFAVAEKVAGDSSSFGIVSCRSGAGVVIAANKVKGIRAVSVSDEVSARHAREHNDANILAISGDWIDEARARKILKIFLETKFTREERHIRRIQMISDYENKPS